jgi:hypothetical protein
MSALWRKVCEDVRELDDHLGHWVVHEYGRRLLTKHSPSISGETPTIESVRELVEKMPRGTIWKTQLDELVEYTNAAVVRFGRSA